jgi:colanic acid biosynthesis glycosyl transferase WcaI
MRSHIHIIPEKKGVSKGALPSKLPNLLAIGVPVLYVGEKNSDVWRLIKDCDAGFCTDSWDFEQLNSLVDQLLIEGEQRSHSDRRYSFQKKYAGFFSVEALVEKLLE